ncbi:MAG TPA: trehalose-6-phosphate synthase [Chroococcales cyanobacterium]
MDVISYRGPGAAGGVASGLESNMSKHGQQSLWWYLKDGALSVLKPGSKEPEFVTQLTDNVIEAHYRFCNEFLWPIMHDLPQFASFNGDDYELYKKFNRTIAEYIGFESTLQHRNFVQDYQFALLPELLRQQSVRSVIFWHIPWPKNVREDHAGIIAEIARGLLGAEIFGFHTQEYADNFRDFVLANLPDFYVDQSSTLRRKPSQSGSASEGQPSAILSPYMTRPLFKKNRLRANATRLIVHPLGIDVDLWKGMADRAPKLEGTLERFNEQPYILSVERADYTKGVLERMQHVERFFETNEDLREKITFLQLCGRTRPGLAAFDQYWNDCMQVLNRVNSRFGNEFWRPIEWHTEHTSPAQLAYIYRNADVMLVNPIRDGLNLTAKEFVACQPNDAGVLVLSPGAGAWHELGKAAVKTDPNDSELMVDSVSQAVHMSLPERRTRISLLMSRIEANPLQSWWERFAQVQHPAVAAGAKTAQMGERNRKIA